MNENVTLWQTLLISITGGVAVYLFTRIFSKSDKKSDDIIRIEKEKASYDYVDKKFQEAKNDLKAHADNEEQKFDMLFDLIKRVDDKLTILLTKSK